MTWKCSKCGYEYLHFDGNGGYVCMNCGFHGKTGCQKCGSKYVHFDSQGGYVCPVCNFHFHG